MTVSTTPRSSRPYRSTLREEQARQTRLAVLDAAGALFVEAGYAATTMKHIAARAGVSVETVYAQGSKSALLLAAVDRTLAGDDEELPVLDRPVLQEVLAEPDPRRRLRLLGGLVAEGLPRAQPVLSAFQAAAGSDPALAPAWAEYERRRLVDMGRLAEGFAGHLRPGLDVADAADLLWALLSPEMCALLDRRGWTAERYASWLVEGLERLLLD